MPLKNIKQYLVKTANKFTHLNVNYAAISDQGLLCSVKGLQGQPQKLSYEQSQKEIIYSVLQE